MEKPSKAMIAAIVLVVLLALALHLSIWLDASCANVARRAVMKAGGGVGCFEFWLNRYQSLLGNVITAGVAGATLLWIAKQLDVSRRQSAVAAAQALRVRIGELQDEVAIVDDLRKTIHALVRVPMTIRGPGALAGMLDAERQLREMWEELQKKALALEALELSGSGRTVDQERRTALTSLRSIHGSLLIVFREMAAIRDLGEWNGGKHTDHYYKIWSQISDYGSQFTHQARLLKMALRGELHATWQQVRRFEQSAVSDDRR